MNRLEKIRRVSGVLRYLLIAAVALIGCALLVAAVSSGQGWVTLADENFRQLWIAGEASRLVLLAIAAPLPAALLLGIYWLQRLFGEYQSGNFFTDGTMRCYLWLVWLKAFSFVYALVRPLLLPIAGGGSSDREIELTIDAGSLLEILVLLVIVHLLKEAQKLHDENKAFV